MKEYEAEELASNSEDEKQIKKAQASALRKKSKVASQNNRTRTNSSRFNPVRGYNRFDPDNKQFFRGNKLLIVYGVYIDFTSSGNLFILSIFMAQNIEITPKRAHIGQCPEIGHFLPGASLSRRVLPKHPCSIRK